MGRRADGRRQTGGVDGCTEGVDGREERTRLDDVDVGWVGLTSWVVMLCSSGGVWWELRWEGAVVGATVGRKAD